MQQPPVLSSARESCPGTNQRPVLSLPGWFQKEAKTFTIISVGLDFPGEPNIMVLSSLHHYYYDHNDLKSIGILINIKKLNQVAHLESFLHTLFRLLPCKSHFVGCFCRTKEETGKSFRQRPVKFFQGLLSGTRFGNGRTLTKESISKLLENNGFILKDLTEINGVTYFWAQNNRRLGD